ncbi:MAG: ABC transporter substrate-binding protein [Gaiellaceae bacterium]
MGVALLLVAAASPHGIKEGGTFRIAGWSFEAIDPAFDPFVLEGAACGKLMGYRDKPIPEGLRLRPELAEGEPVVSRDGKTYTFIIRKKARFSDDKPVTARAFARALERILTPAMESFLSGKFSDIVGAQKMLDGKATTLAGAVAKGRTLTLRLTRRVPDFLVRTTALCAVPPTLPIDPEGVQAPIHSAAPYYGSQYVPGERLVLERNRFYKRNRVHHVARFVANIAADPRPFVEDVANGTLESVGLRASDIAGVVDALARRYGVNKPGGQFFIERGTDLRMFVLNTSRPLFKNNSKLRQALNLAVDRRQLTRELGPRIGTATDQYLAPVTPGFRDERIYPLKGPDLKEARALAKGHMRRGKVVLYTPNLLARAAGGQVLKENLEALGLEVDHVQHPPTLHFAKIANPSEPFDIADVGFGWDDPHYLLNVLFDGRTIGQPGFYNRSYFDSSKYNRLLEEASRLTGSARYRAYGELDVMLSRDAAPAIPFAVLNNWAFVSARVGCVVMNPWLDLTAICLK